MPRKESRPKPFARKREQIMAEVLVDLQIYAIYLMRASKIFEGSDLNSFLSPHFKFYAKNLEEVIERLRILNEGKTPNVNCADDNPKPNKREFGGCYLNFCDEHLRHWTECEMFKA